VICTFLLNVQNADFTLDGYDYYYHAPGESEGELPDISPASRAAGRVPSRLLVQALMPRVSSPKQIKLNVASEFLSLKAFGYHPVSRFLPFPVLEETGEATLQTVPHNPTSGGGESRRFRLSLHVDMTAGDRWADGDHLDTDIGSRQWLLANTLAEGRDDEVYESAASEKKEENLDPNALPEDKHHLKLPPNVDQYTGVPFDIEDEVLPEDRFHRNDLMSQHMIDQKRRDVEEKHKRAEEERQKRKMEAGDDTVYIESKDDIKKAFPDKQGTSNSPESKNEDMGVVPTVTPSQAAVEAAVAWSSRYNKKDFVSKPAVNVTPTTTTNSVGLAFELV